MRARVLAAACALALAGCMVGPDFHPPVVHPPGVWGPERTDVPSRTIAADIDPQWWRSFHDAELTSLVRLLVARNLDLGEATERIVQARAQREVVASQGLPHIEEQSSYMRERQSLAGFIKLLTPAPHAPVEYDIFQNGLMSSWDLDLFGRVRRGIEAQNAQILASVDNRRGVALMALADLAQDYLQLRGIQAELAIAEGNLTNAAENTALVQNRFANGVATTLDMAQARAQQATIAATLPPLRVQQASLINAIGLLLAEPPRALLAELLAQAASPPIPPLVPIGLPGTLVRRRPDVLQAEANLHAATAQTGVAVAAFYPDISLSAMANLNGLYASDAFSLPARAFDFGPVLSLPIFQGGQLRGVLRLRKSQQREAAIAFRRTVLQAWQEVDDALTAFAETQGRRDQVAEAVRQGQIALEAARQQYVQGAADFLNVVSAESMLLQNQDNLARTNTEIATDLVRLYRALGGGWQVAEGQGASPPERPNPITPVAFPPSSR